MLWLLANKIRKNGFKSIKHLSVTRFFYMMVKYWGILIGTTWKVAPQRSLTVSCPVKHCGRTLNITWCKVLQSHCEQLNKTENVAVRQNHNQANDELVSYLSFKQISIYDDGLYRCKFIGDRLGEFSHSIKISEMPTHMIPDFPKWTHSFSPVLRSSVCTVNDIHSSTSPETPKSSPALSPTGDQPAVSNTADKSQPSASAVYAVISHRQTGMAARKQNTAPTEDKNPQYAVIKVP
uniref:Ig-like domain-containing protein n=1 Tax=Amphiprion percula TaxID=161767 RepID=A0A3P8RNK8_AMPPE